jgi:hypothetical protein
LDQEVSSTLIQFHSSPVVSVVIVAEYGKSLNGVYVKEDSKCLNDIKDKTSGKGNTKECNKECNYFFLIQIVRFHTIQEF